MIFLRLVAFVIISSFSIFAVADELPKFTKLKTQQYIAVLGDPSASSGTGAETWGIWLDDPAFLGVRLGLFSVLKATGGYAPGGWVFDENDWWLEEHGWIIDRPVFPLPAGRYLVTGAREVTAILTVHPKDSSGQQHWELNKGATLHDVTHLGCRSARYTPETEGSVCSPAGANKSDFIVPAGQPMPDVTGCHKQDYEVLIVVAVEVED